MKYTGHLIIKEGDNTDYSQLTEVTGDLYIDSNAKLEANNLTSVGGDLCIRSDAKLEANNLTSVGGYLSIYSNAKLDNLTSVTGDLFIYSNAKLEANNLTSVGGNLYINSIAKLDNLTSVGGYLSIYSNAKLEANNLTSVGGGLYINSNAKLEAAFLKNFKWKLVDGNIFIIESTKSKGDIKIYKGYNAKGVKDNVIKIEDCYVAESGEFYAHGESIKQAVEDLQFKLISEKLKNEPINKDTIIDTKYYRLVTGACEFGVKSFIEANELKNSYKASELLPILESKHAYGIEKFKSLLTF